MACALFLGAVVHALRLLCTMVPGVWSRRTPDDLMISGFDNQRASSPANKRQ